MQDKSKKPEEPQAASAEFEKEARDTKEISHEEWMESSQQYNSTHPCASPTGLAMLGMPSAWSI